MPHTPRSTGLRQAGGRLVLATLVSIGAGLLSSRGGSGNDANPRSAGAPLASIGSDFNACVDLLTRPVPVTLP